MNEYTIQTLPPTNHDLDTLSMLSKHVVETLLNAYPPENILIDYTIASLQGRLLHLFGRVLQYNGDCKHNLIVSTVSTPTLMDTVYNTIVNNNTPGIVLFQNSRFYSPKTELPVTAKLEALPALEGFLKSKQSGNVKAYLLRKTLLIEHKTPLTMENFYAIICTYMSIYEKEGYGEIPKELKAFFEGLSKNNVEQVNENINKLIDLQELRRKKFSRYEAMFMDRFSKTKQDIEFKIQEAQQNIQNHLECFAKETKRVQDLNAMYAGLEERDAKADQKAIIEFLIKNPYIADLECMTSHILIIHYKAPIKYFERNIMHILLTKHPDNNFLKILQQDKYELWTECTILLDTYSFKVSPNNSTEVEDYIGHPHLHEYSCMGSHPDEIAEWIKNNDYIGAFEQISYMVLELNLADTVVFKNLCAQLKKHAHRPTFMNKQTKEFKSYNEIIKEMENEESTINE